MSARQPVFDLVRTSDGHHAVYRAANRKRVWWTENYRREQGALDAIEMFTGNPVTVSAWGLEVFHEGTAELLEVRRVDLRTAK